MKFSSILFLILCISGTCLAQSETVYFDYDEAGNRYRKFVFRSMNANEVDNIVRMQDHLAPLALEEDKSDEPKQPNDGFSLYPNPTRDHVIIDFPENTGEGDCTYELYSSEGVLQTTGQTRKFPVQIDFSPLATGKYYLQISNGAQIETFSIIKL